MPNTVQAVPEKPELRLSKLTRVLSKLSLKPEERKQRSPRSPKAFTPDTLHVPWSVSIPFGISESRARDYVRCTLITSTGRPFLPQYSEIILDRLFISDRYTGTEPAVLSKLGITHVVCVVSSSMQTFRPLAEIQYHDMVVSTDASCCLLARIDDTVDFIDNALRGDGRVLIHCSTGVAWSPSVAIAWLMRNEGCTYEMGKELVKRKREVANPTLQIEKGVREWWALEMARPLFPPGRGGREPSALRYTFKVDILDDDSLGEVIDIK